MVCPPGRHDPRVRGCRCRSRHRRMGAEGSPEARRRRRIGPAPGERPSCTLVSFELRVHVLEGMRIDMAGMGTPVLPVIDQTVATSPHDVAVQDLDGALTYDELSVRAERLARRLRVAGVKPGD